MGLLVEKIDTWSVANDPVMQSRDTTVTLKRFRLSISVYLKKYEIFVRQAVVFYGI